MSLVGGGRKRRPVHRRHRLLPGPPHRHLPIRHMTIRLDGDQEITKSGRAMPSTSTSGHDAWTDNDEFASSWTPASRPTPNPLSRNPKHGQCQLGEASGTRRGRESARALNEPSSRRVLTGRIPGSRPVATRHRPPRPRRWLTLNPARERWPCPERSASSLSCLWRSSHSRPRPVCWGSNDGATDDRCRDDRECQATTGLGRAGPGGGA